MTDILNSSNAIEQRFVAFIDLLGFSAIISRIEQSKDKDDPELHILKSILNFMDQETYEPNYSTDLPIYVKTEEGLIEKELGDPRLTYISDCLIISAEPTLEGFKALSRKIHKITADLAFDGIFCRGAISKGKLFHNNKIIFGSSYIRAYELEKNEAKYPRIIIDPEILSFFDLSNGKMPLAPAFYGKDTDGYYYLRYWTWCLFPPYAGDWNTYLNRVKLKINKNLDSHKNDTKTHGKYVWLQNEYNNLITLWKSVFQQ